MKVISGMAAHIETWTTHTYTHTTLSVTEIEFWATKRHSESESESESSEQLCYTFDTHWAVAYLGSLLSQSAVLERNRRVHYYTLNSVVLISTMYVCIYIIIEAFGNPGCFSLSIMKPQNVWYFELSYVRVWSSQQERTPQLPPRKLPLSTLCSPMYYTLYTEATCTRGCSRKWPALWANRVWGRFFSTSQTAH